MYSPLGYNGKFPKTKAAFYGNAIIENYKQVLNYKPNTSV